MEKDLSVFFPGREVTLSVGVKIKVFPLGVSHIQEFNKSVQQLVRVVLNHDFSTGKSVDEMITAIGPTLFPLFLGDLLHLVQACCSCDEVETFRLGDLPHSELPPIVEAWFDESFGTKEKILPWGRAIDRVMEKLTGQPFSITEAFSNLSSPQDTVE